MSRLVVHDSTVQAIVLPHPRVSVNIRLANQDDLMFIDALQKMHSHMVGFMPGKQIEKYIADGNVLIAEEQAKIGPSGGAVQIGYVLFRYQYMMRDEVGIVYQLNVMPIRHRHLVGATLIKAVFDRAPYGCKLFCCWCAQDIQANWFWESIGFVPLAFRTGSRAKQRIHIFWQRRIRDNDGGPGATPYWFPAETKAGAVAEERIVLPIPPGTHWRDAKPTILPGLPALEPQVEAPELLPGGQPVCPRKRPRMRPRTPDAGGQPKLTRSQRAAIVRSQSTHLGAAPLGKRAVIRGGRIKYVDIPGFDPSTDGPEELAPLQKPKKPRRAGPRQKNDPKYVAAARELRDRYLEEVNADRLLPGANGKYDVSRALEAAASCMTTEQAPLPRLLDAA